VADEKPDQKPGLTLDQKIAIVAAVANSVQALVAVIQSVGAALTSARSVVIEVANNTDLTLTKLHSDHDSGGFAQLPALAIPPHSVDVFGSQSKGGAIATGTVGSVTYVADGLEILVGWNNPFSGDNKTNIGPNNFGLGGPNAKRFLAVHQTGVGNEQAHMRFMLFVHPPYLVTAVFKGRGDLRHGIFKALGMQPGSGIRAQLPNTTEYDATS
jgi:hypothetical protein